VIKSSVSAWQSATATYSNNVCVLSTQAGVIGTLQIFLYGNIAVAPLPVLIGYDVTRDDGQILRYTIQGGGIAPPPGTSLRLVPTGSGFTLTDDEDNVETYNSSGVLQTITSRTGVVQTMSYEANGRLSTVTDSFGNALTLGRSAAGALSSVTFNGGSAVQYAYDSNSRLNLVTNLDGTTRAYVYGDSRFVNALTGVIDENGTQLTSWGYDAQERATSTQQAGGANLATIAYNTNEKVTTTDALGAVRTFNYKRIGDTNRPTSITGSQCPTCEEMAATDYDSAGWVSSRTDYNGNVTCYASDPARGLELVRVEGFASGSSCPTNLAAYVPAAGSSERKISTVWHTTFRLPTLIIEATRTTSFGYDSSGNLLTRTVTDTTVNPSVSRTWTYTYNSYGRVLTANGPRTDVNDTTTFTYYTCATGSQCGQIQTITDALGHVWSYNSYNAFGQPLTITDPNGVLTTLAYDARLRLTSRSTVGETTGFSYYPTGLLKKVTLVGGGRKLHTSGGRKLHSAFCGLRERSWSDPCTRGSTGCCYVTIWSRGLARPPLHVRCMSAGARSITGLPPGSWTGNSMTVPCGIHRGLLSRARSTATARLSARG
jgi:YD repeat-containing protein